MPNWCENKLQINCSFEQAEILKPKLFTTTDDGQYCLDFNFLVPMPEDLNISSCSTGVYSKRLLELPRNKRLTYSIIKDYVSSRYAKKLYKKAKRHH